MKQEMMQSPTWELALFPFQEAPDLKAGSCGAWGACFAAIPAGHIYTVALTRRSRSRPALALASDDTVTNWKPTRCVRADAVWRRLRRARRIASTAMVSSSEVPIESMNPFDVDGSEAHEKGSRQAPLFAVVSGSMRSNVDSFLRKIQVCKSQSCRLLFPLIYLPGC